MVEILPRDWSLRPIFTQKWTSVSTETITTLQVTLMEFVCRSGYTLDSTTALELVCSRRSLSLGGWKDASRRVSCGSWPSSQSLVDRYDLAALRWQSRHCRQPKFKDDACTPMRRLCNWFYQYGVTTVLNYTEWLKLTDTNLHFVANNGMNQQNFYDFWLKMCCYRSRLVFTFQVLLLIRHWRFIG